jgi:uncharacterized protein (DUF1778 family)
VRNLSVRVDDAEYDLIKERAAFYGMSLQDFVLSAAKAEAGIVDSSMIERVRADLVQNSDVYAALAALDPPAGRSAA